MRIYIYTGSVDVNLDIAQELLRAADQYLLEGLKRLCEYAIAQHNEREFLLKFSAMEIYNESVRDLLSTDSTPLRLLDDPETIESSARQFLGKENLSTLTAAVEWIIKCLLD
ncbi:Kinesin-like protein KIN-7J [Camellia lanceoleosa]|uniref:Kinesin-like protein KIN-7J n=1 Tax=Camellia lanceoleosa TaxID=1840588 RepID=A0ACC0HMF7_9ERIC|nr:Kinesin-like protein KIN-7J [Camellia lanceoleosa]